MTSKLLALREMYAEQKPGCCIMCDEPLPPHFSKFVKRRVCCADPECRSTFRTLYHRAYGQLRRKLGMGARHFSGHIEAEGRTLW